MPKVLKQPDFLQRIAELEEKVAVLQRTTRVRDEVPFCAVCQRAIERILDLYSGEQP